MSRRGCMSRKVGLLLVKVADFVNIRPFRTTGQPRLPGNNKQPQRLLLQT